MHYAAILALVVGTIATAASVFGQSQEAGARTLAARVTRLEQGPAFLLPALVQSAGAATFTTSEVGGPSCDAMTGCHGVAKAGPGPGVVAGEAKAATDATGAGVARGPIEPPVSPLERWLGGNTVAASAGPRERFGHLHPRVHRYVWRFGDGGTGEAFPTMTGTDHAALAELQRATMEAEDRLAEARNAYATAWQARRAESSSWRSITPFVDSRDDYATAQLRGTETERAVERARVALEAARAAEQAHIEAARTRFATALAAQPLPDGVVANFVASTPEARDDALARMTSTQFHALLAAMGRMERPAAGPERDRFDAALARLRNPLPPQLVELFADRSLHWSVRQAAEQLTVEDRAALWAAWAEERALERESESLADAWRDAAEEDFAGTRRALTALENERQRLLREFEARSATMPIEMRRHLGTGTGAGFRSFLEEDFEWRVFYQRRPDGSIGVSGRFVPRRQTMQRMIRQSLVIGSHHRAPVMEIGWVQREQPYIPPVGPMQTLYYRLHGRSEIGMRSTSFGHMRSVLMQDVFTVYFTVTGVGGLLRAGGVMATGFRGGASLVERQLAVQTARRLAAGLAIGEAQRRVVNELIPGNDPNSAEARFWLNFTLSTATQIVMMPRRPAAAQPGQPRPTNPTGTAAAGSRRTPLFVRNSCFTAGTQVRVACDVDTLSCAPHEKAIEDVKVGDLVFSVHERTGLPMVSPVKNVMRRTTGSLRIVAVEGVHGAEEIRTTDEHPFFVEGEGFVPAKALRPGSVLRGSDDVSGPSVAATREEEHPEGIDVWNLTVAEAHTYFVAAASGAEPLLVHNADQCSLDDIFTGVNTGSSTARAAASNLASAAELAKAAGHTPQAIAARVASELRNLPAHLQGPTRTLMNGEMTRLGLGTQWTAAAAVPAVAATAGPSVAEIAAAKREVAPIIRSLRRGGDNTARLDHDPNQPGVSGLPNVQIGPPGSPGIYLGGRVRAEGWAPNGWPPGRPLTPEALLSHPTLGSRWRELLPQLRAAGWY